MSACLVDIRVAIDEKFLVIRVYPDPVLKMKNNVHVAQIGGIPAFMKAEIAALESKT